MAGEAVPLIEFEGVSFSYGSEPVLKDVSVKVWEGDIIALLGPSGCGKSTVLRLISGLETAEEGVCRFDGKVVCEPQRQMFYGFQDYDAFPWLTVKDNVKLMMEFGGEVFGHRYSLEEILDAVGLRGAETKYPRELSGGMQKRLAFARCLGSGARALLLDEPFSSLDVRARSEMQKLVHQTVVKVGGTAVVVTHDVDEAIFLASRVLVCSGPPFKIVQEVVLPMAIPRDDGIRSRLDFEEAYLRVRSYLTRGEG